ncbi:hypothetical protein EVB62_008 [Rhizobium phage RHph_TM33]|uniref:Uncharacterized protein n=1 Tax=Rhizobium phage RHph_TM33 TaxID=2509765 RepID=A0A7S5R5N1_9CAUD|nr:hypothetical protein EVB62_008 [Rhizobium phage RHph_TM33]QIG68467.1 hypothetical protein EVB63_008 [Rhizobium phage RHph_TM38]
MSDLDLINQLGLGTETVTETAAEVAADAEAATTSRAPRTEIKITGTIAKSSGRLPARATNGGGFGDRESKYPFESLAAPVLATDEEGEYWSFDFFEVKLSDVENADAKKLQGAIQAAAAAQNKKNREEGTGIKYVTRTVLGENEEYVGSAVYRVDDKAQG